MASHVDRIFRETSKTGMPGGCSIADKHTNKVFWNTANNKGTKCKEHKKCVCHPYDLDQETCANPLAKVACEDAATAAKATYKVVTRENRPRGCYRDSRSGSVYYNKYDERENGKECTKRSPCVCKPSGADVMVAT